MPNISKKRTFPIVTRTKKQGGGSYVNDYFVYDLTRKQLGIWLNIWFKGEQTFDKDGKLVYETMYTVKEVDTKTSYHLYDRKFNPISLRTMPIFSKTRPNVSPFGEPLYNFKAMIQSVDDSSYGMWWTGVTLPHIQFLKDKLMRYVDSQRLLNGDEWFDFGRHYGADDFDTN